MSIILFWKKKYAFIFWAFQFFKFFSFFKMSFYGPITNFFTSPRLQTVFPKLEFLFSILSSILSKNVYKSRWKLRNAKIYPLEVQIYKLFLFMSLYGQFRQFFHISQPILSKQFPLKFVFCFRFHGVEKHVKIASQIENSQKFTQTHLVMTK